MKTHRLLTIYFGFALIILVECTNGQSQAGATGVTSVTATPQEPPVAAAEACPDELIGLTESMTSGTAVIWDQSADKKRAFLWNLTTNIQTDLPGESERISSPYALISPNRQRLAFFEYLKNEKNTLGPVRLTVTDRQGQVILSVENTWENWTGLVGWLNDHQLMLDGFDINGSPHPTVVLDLDSRSEKTIPATYPQIFRSSQQYMGWWGSFGTTMTIYDSTQSLVIYPISPQEIVLYNIDQHRELIQIQVGSPYGSEPQWSPDNKTFAVDISRQGADPGRAHYSDEIYIVDRSGEIVQLTNFTDTFAPVDVREYQWSPNGRQIAFWYSTNLGDGIFELGVVDVSSKKVMTYCIAQRIRSSEDRIPAPVWSPDSRQILVAGIIKEGGLSIKEDTSRLLLVDIAGSFVSRLGDGLIPFGWMENNQ